MNTLSTPPTPAQTAYAQQLLGTLFNDGSFTVDVTLDDVLGINESKVQVDLDDVSQIMGAIGGISLGNKVGLPAALVFTELVSVSEEDRAKVRELAEAVAEYGPDGNEVAAMLPVTVAYNLAVGVL